MTDQPTLSIFTGSETFGQVFREQSQIIRQVLGTSLPLTGSSSRLNFNILGATRIIIIQGATSGEGYSGLTQNDKLGEFIDNMEEWVNANIPDTETFTDSFGVSYSVQPVDFTWTRMKGDPFRISYSLLMKEGGGL